MGALRIPAPEEVKSGEVQLHLYDRGKSRIIEMIGAPDQGYSARDHVYSGHIYESNAFYDGVRERTKPSRGKTHMPVSKIIFVLVWRTIQNVAWPLDPSWQASSTRCDRTHCFREPSKSASDTVSGIKTSRVLKFFGAEYEKSISLSGAGTHEQWIPDAEMQ